MSTLAKPKSTLETWMPRIAALGVATGGVCLLIANATEASIGGADFDFLSTDDMLVSAAPATMTMSDLRKENLTSHTLRTVASISFTVAGAALVYDVFVSK